MNHRTEAFDEAYENLSIPIQGTFLTGEGAMDLAWRLALQGVGLVRSNPLVGAVCVDKDHKFVAGAYHQSFGKAHAEQALIKKIYEEGLEDFLNEGTVYVTLEPCSHIGNTPSCAHLLSEQPLKSVVYGVPDPTEKTSG